MFPDREHFRAGWLQPKATMAPRLHSGKRRFSTCTAGGSILPAIVTESSSVGTRLGDPPLVKAAAGGSFERRAAFARAVPTISDDEDARVVRDRGHNSADANRPMGCAPFGRAQYRPGMW